MKFNSPFPMRPFQETFKSPSHFLKCLFLTRWHNRPSEPDRTMFIYSQLKLLLLLSGIFQVHVQKLLSCPAIGLLVNGGG